MTEFLPCPFCGGNPKVESGFGGFWGMCSVKCDCGAEMRGTANCRGDSAQEAIRTKAEAEAVEMVRGRWNSRSGSRTSESDLERIRQALDVIDYPFGAVTEEDSRTDWPEGGPIRREIEKLKRWLWRTETKPPT